MRKSLVTKLWLAIVLLVLGVFLFSVAVQAQQIRSFFYNQQARFYIYEAEEVASIFRAEDRPDIIKERLLILHQFLSANITVIDDKGNVLYDQPGGSKTGSGIEPRHEFIKKTLEGHNTVFTGKLEEGSNEEIFLATVPIRKDGRILGAVIVNSPLSALNRQINGILSIAVFGALLGVFLATVLSVFISRKLTSPLVEMKKTAQAIAGGDFGRQLNVSSDDEVGHLAQSLNRMSSQLQEKIEAIERLDKVRQEFVSDVSHELRTPLTIIQGFSEAVLDGLVKSKEQQELYLKNIIDETRRLRSLVDDLLDLKAMEAGKTFDEMEYVILNKLVNMTADRFRQVASLKGVEIKTVLPPQVITVPGNIDRLKQVFTNLFDNAINHSNPGGNVAVELDLRRDFAVIAVKDSGPGIPPEELENIWERFYKVDKSRSRRGTGTGLGLSIVKNIVELHGGTVTAESQPGNGAVFTVFLPVSAQSL